MVELDAVLKEMEHIKNMHDVKKVMHEIRQKGIILTPRDVTELREISRMEHLAEMKALPADKVTGVKDDSKII